MEIYNGRELARVVNDELEKRGYSKVYSEYPKRALWLYVRRHTYITTIDHVSYFAGIGVRTTINYWFDKFFTEERL